MVWFEFLRKGAKPPRRKAAKAQRKDNDVVKRGKTDFR
jgi:hypothetical protein